MTSPDSSKNGGRTNAGSVVLERSFPLVDLVVGLEFDGDVDPINYPWKGGVLKIKAGR